MHECYYSCLVVLFTRKSRQSLEPTHAPAAPGLQRDYKVVTSMLSKKTIFDIRDNFFLNKYFNSGFQLINISKSTRYPE